jgi:1-acyl-sn-glycerol-3-phosphate acyltransferase
MYKTFRTILGSYLFLLMITLPIITTSLLKKTSDLPHIMHRNWAKYTLSCADTSVEVSGRKNIPDGPAIYMANHSSFFDVFAVLGHLDVPFRWIVKKELFKVPLLGINMKRSGHICVDRGNHEKALKSIELATEKIRSGTSIFIFPEGTRSDDGVLRYPFKKGGFHLALLSGAPIVPIAIIGAREILPKNGMIVKPGNIKLVIGEPIYPNGHCIESLMEETFISISDCLSESPSFKDESVT